MKYHLSTISFCLILTATTYGKNPHLGFNPRVQALAFMYPAQAQLILTAAE